nr:MAG TPA: hypothetical protein [Caudoviricetes sp.]
MASVTDLIRELYHINKNTHSKNFIYAYYYNYY